MSADLGSRIPSQLRAAYDRSTRSMIPTLHALRYGGAAPLEKLTTEANTLATLATRAGRAWQSIHATHWNSAVDETASPATRLVRSAKHARGLIDTLRTEYDAALSACESRQRALQAKLDTAGAPPSSVGAAMADSEARALIRACTDPLKAAELARAHPRAVATVSPDVAGIAPELHATIRGAYLDTVAPDDAAAMRDLRAAFTVATEALRNLEHDAGEIIDFASAERISAGADWQPVLPEVA